MKIFFLKVFLKNTFVLRMLLRADKSNFLVCYLFLKTLVKQEIDTEKNKVPRTRS